MNRSRLLCEVHIYLSAAKLFVLCFLLGVSSLSLSLFVLPFPVDVIEQRKEAGRKEPGARVWQGRRGETSTHGFQTWAPNLGPYLFRVGPYSKILIRPMA